MQRIKLQYRKVICFLLVVPKVKGKHFENRKQFFCNTEIAEHSAKYKNNYPVTGAKSKSTLSLLGSTNALFILLEIPQMKRIKNHCIYFQNLTLG